MMSTAILASAAANWTFPSRNELQILDIFEAPIWVFDIERHGMWWANRAAIRFWQAASLDELIGRDYSSDSSTVRKRLRQIYNNAPLGQPTLDSWTLYPGDKPIPANLRYIPVQIGTGRRDALLIEAALSDNDGIDSTDMRVVEATRYTSIMISYFTLDGDLLSMTPAATEAFSYGRASGSEKEMVDARSKCFPPALPILPTATSCCRKFQTAGSRMANS